MSRFSLAATPRHLLKGPGLLGRALALGVALGATALVAPGCGSDTPDPVCNGVARDGQCFAVCDEALDCKGDTSLHCVAYPNHPEGKCFATCGSNDDCAVGDSCQSGTSLKGLAGQFCVARPILGLPAGKSGDTCAKKDDCDGAHGLACLNGKCGTPPKVVGLGAACSATAVCDPSLSLSCVDGVCAAPPAGPGEACSATVLCDAAQNLVCTDGTCGPPPAGPGEPCSDEILCGPGLGCVDGACAPKAPGPGEACSESNPCEANLGIACAEGYCRATCESVVGACASGFECRSLPAGDPSGAPGVCLPSATGLAGPGQYGTFCPNPAACDKAGGFFCRGVGGDANAFCTKKDGCEADTDCPSGFWCGAVTNVTDDVGNVDFDHPIKACLLREFCAPCETDLDCSAKTGGICVADVNGEKFCSLPCNAAKNSCQIGVSCVDTGDGRTACRPDVGVCHAEAPKGCDPCRVDTDCGPGGLCKNGAVGNKPGMRWCSTPCGGPDASGKNTCPLAPNGLEMICLDENEIALGGPFGSDQPNSIYKHCYTPLTVDNTEAFNGKDPPNGACGNSKREGDEECDDGNKSKTDGCDQCKITDACRFTLSEPNADGMTTLQQNGMSIDKVPTSCKSFLVEGAIETAGDVDSLRFTLPDGASTWAELFTDQPGTCSGDLVLEVRGGDVDLNVKCQDLDASIKNLDAETPTLCPDNATLGCGSCETPGICGACDDDSGIGDCPRLLLSSTLQFQGYKVKYDSAVKTVRIYARDPAATVAHYLFVVDRLTPGSQGPASPPGLGCY